MPLTVGSRLGPYEIVSPLGAGGMGEVFRARDTRLDRSVAIKVLPHELAANAQLRQRFEREAKTISQLNHPNICVLHDVGHEDGTDFLVMELLEGETLADRLARGPLPLSETIRYGAQIADALDCAHRAGIVHRDLKPGNVMLLKGVAKLLDFGLAKPGTASPANVATTLATEQKPLTQEGTIVGTFQYMAPEQLEGTEADARTDIFAFGALLYEMVAGRRAFDGKTRTSLIASIVGSDPPPLSQLQPLTPPALEHVIRKCLAKDPDERWQSAHDVAAELRWIGEAGSQAGVAAPLTARRKHRERLAWGLHLATAAAAIALTWAFLHWRAPAPRVLETNIVPPPDREFAGRQGNVLLSPDGTRIAMVAADHQGDVMIFVRRLDSSEARPIAGTEGAVLPFWTFDLAGNRSSRLTFNPANESAPVWSADDREIFYFSVRAGGDSDLFRIASGGIGEEQPLVESHVAKLPADVSRDGQWLLFVGNSGKGQLYDIWTYSFRDKQARPWLATPFNEAAPQLSPDGKWIAYQSDESGRNEVYVRSFPDSQEKFPVSNAGGRMPAWRSDGRELYYVSSDSKMMAVPVDTSKGFQSGSPAPLFEVRLLDHPQLKQYVATDGTRFLLNRVVTTDQHIPVTLVQNWTSRLKTAQ